MCVSILGRVYFFERVVSTFCERIYLTVWDRFVKSVIIYSFDVRPGIDFLWMPKVDGPWNYKKHVKSVKVHDGVKIHVKGVKIELKGINFLENWTWCLTFEFFLEIDCYFACALGRKLLTTFNVRLSCAQLSCAFDKSYTWLALSWK